MPRHPPSDSSDSDSDYRYEHSRRHASPVSSSRRGRRPASVSHGESRRPHENHDQRQLYHRASSERRNFSDDDEPGESRRHRPHRRLQNAETFPRSHSPRSGITASGSGRRAASQPRPAHHHHDSRSDRHSDRRSDHRDPHTADDDNERTERPRYGARRSSSTAPRFHRQGDPNADRDERDHRYPPSASRSKTAYGSRDDRDRDRNTSRDRRRSHDSRSGNGNGRPRSRSHSNSASKGGKTPSHTTHEVLMGAGRTAFEAGAMAALKMRSDKGPWLGSKGAKIAAAAISAAAVDTFMEQKHPQAKGGMRHTMMRQGTQLLISNLVMRPAANGMGKSLHGKK